jgi:hypothetical protein
LQARVGLNIGEVVVRSIQTREGPAEYTPIGHSISLAARMQTLAPVGSIATTDATRRVCEGYFTFKSLGPTSVKGVSELIEVCEVIGLGPLRTRLQRAEARGLTKFVGREREMEALGHAAELARMGAGNWLRRWANRGRAKSGSQSSLSWPSPRGERVKPESPRRAGPKTARRWRETKARWSVDRQWRRCSNGRICVRHSGRYDAIKGRRGLTG